MAAEPNARDAKLIQYLTEAYGKEKELETALEAHIAMTTRAPYKKRLQEHLKETKRHARDVERRIKKLGGQAGRLTEAATVAQELANRGIALVTGAAHAVRGTGANEKMLKNAKTEYSNEAEEIAQYTAIETLATTVGDKDTAQLARTIRREEERMGKFLEKLIPQLTKAVATEEIPAALRRTGTTRRRKTSSSRRSSAATRSASSRSSGGAKRSTAKRSTAGAKRSTAAKRSTGSSRSGSSRSTRSRSSSRSSGS